MASILVATTARRLSSLRFSNQVSVLTQRRGLAGAADHHGPRRVNCWKDPMNPAKCKEEHKPAEASH